MRLFVVSNQNYLNNLSCFSSTSCLPSISPFSPTFLAPFLSLAQHTCSSFGIVCACINTSNDLSYAVKFIEVSEDGSTDLQNEIDILKTTSECPYVVCSFSFSLPPSLLPHLLLSFFFLSSPQSYLSSSLYLIVCNGLSKLC